jgi:hypothetical protein
MSVGLMQVPFLALQLRQHRVTLTRCLARFLVLITCAHDTARPQVADERDGLPTEDGSSCYRVELGSRRQRTGGGPRVGGSIF